MRMYDAVDLFAGAGGWDVAAQSLGLHVLGVELNEDACRTRRAAGLPTLEVDVRTTGPTDVAALGLIASPPCQTFSVAGKGAGRERFEMLTDNVKRYVARDERAMHGDYEDERTALVLEPLRWALQALDADEPYYWMAFEQVPTVLPVWDEMAVALEAEGYEVWTGILSAEEYGVPQTRKRAILTARFVNNTGRPAPTHRAYRKGAERAGGNQALMPWVSMADAVGWGHEEAPSPTVCAGGTSTGGAEPFGPSVRRTLIDARDHSQTWRLRSNYSDSSARLAGDRMARTMREMHEPAPTVTGKSHQWSCDSASVRITPEEAAALQTFPAGFPWQGNKTSRYQQIGNAVPPRLAEAILRSVAL